MSSRDKRKSIQEETKMLASILSFDIGALGLNATKKELTVIKESKKNILAFKNLSKEKIISIYENTIATHEKQTKTPKK